jgi:hypothetical protein
MPQSNPIGYDGSGGFGAAFYANYKEVFGPASVEPLVYKNRPFLKDIVKKDLFEGANYAHTIIYEDPQGGSATFQTSLQNELCSSQSARLMIWRGREYQAIQLDNEEIRASRSNIGALLQKKGYETKRVLEEMSRRIDISLHGSGSGIIGSFTTGTTLNSATIQLDQSLQCVRFSNKMWLQLSTTNPLDGTLPALGNAGALAQVVAIQRSSTQTLPTLITLNQPLNNWIPAVTANTQYFLLRAGDGVGFGQNVLKGGVCGLKAWLPAPPAPGVVMGTRLAPTDSFWGFNRNVDSQRLAGCVYQAQPGDKYTVTYQNAGKELFINGGGNEAGKMMLYVSPEDYTGYALELGPQVRYSDMDEGFSGFKRLVVETQAGPLMLTPDPQIEPGLFYILDRDTYYLRTLDAVPHLDESDGLTALRSGMNDAQEIRWRSWHQMVMDEPGKNLVGRSS